MSKRVKFFISHLLLSLCVIGAILTFVLMVWYPAPLSHAVGVTQIMLILASIDVVVGPVLGFLVYKEHKKSLKFDLSVIVLVQICALCFGVYSVAQGRPVWVVYNVDRFQVVRNNELIIQNPDEVKAEYRTAGWGKPKFVGAEFAKDVDERQTDMFTEVATGMSIAQMPKRYVPIDAVATQIQKRTLPITLLDKYNPADQVQSITTRYPTATGYVPLKANAVDMTVLVDKESKVVKIVDLRPW